MLELNSGTLYYHKVMGVGERIGRNLESKNARIHPNDNSNCLQLMVRRMMSTRPHYTLAPLKSPVFTRKPPSIPIIIHGFRVYNPVSGGPWVVDKVGALGH